MVGKGARVSIPVTTRQMIHNIKEITAGNYSEDEILAMLNECNMDPNETIQRLLLQDPFHEVKKKRHKRKENIVNKDSVESLQRSGGHQGQGQGRGGSRGGRMNFSSRRDGVGAKNSFRKENGSKQVNDPSASTSQEMKTKEIAFVSSPSSAVIDKSSVGLTSGSSEVRHPTNLPAKAAATSVPSSKSRAKNAERKSADPMSLPRTSSSEVRSASSNLKPASEQRAHDQQTGENKFHARSRGVGKSAMNDGHVQRPASSHSNSTGSRPSSKHSNRSHQNPQRGTGSIKEWKPKSGNHNNTIEALAVPTEALAVPTEASEKSVEDVIPSAEATSGLQSQLGDLHIQRQHVIIPNHILVPEAERTKLSFGSFDAGFSITSSSVASPENERRSAPLSQDSQDVEASIEEQEEEETDFSESPSQVQDDIAGESITVTNVAPEYDISKQESMLEPETNQNSFDYIPSNIVGNQLRQFENDDTQGRDALRIPNFMVQQPFDPASYYPQFYRSGPDGDGRVSPFVSPGVASKVNGNITVMPPHSSQTMPEVGNNLPLSTASPPPSVTQPVGLMQSSIPVTQQHVPMFRPQGLHMPHYPQNYVPYGHYFSPLYLPPPPMHPFLSNGSAFTQQPQPSGGVYPPGPPPPGAGTGGGKYTLRGMPGGYGPAYGYSNNPTSAASGGNSTSNEDLNSLQMKENNGYNTTGQQSEAMPVWIGGAGRDMPNSFYGLQHHGQHYAPPQAGHVTFPGMYHHPGRGGVHHHPLLQQHQQSQGGAPGGEMVTPGSNVFQQPQQNQMNWPSNY